VTTVLAQGITHTTGWESAIFYVLGTIAVLAALGLVLARSAIHCALMLVVVQFCLAVFYFAQDAPFLGAVQIIVYAGAIMVLFLFVIMLIGIDSSDSLVEVLRGQRVAAVVLGFGFAGLIVFPTGSAIAGTTLDGAGVTVSIGVASFPEDGTEAADLLDAADAGLSAAIEAGGDRVQAAAAIASSADPYELAHPLGV